jgi:hypothetical protein
MSVYRKRFLIEDSDGEVEIREFERMYEGDDEVEVSDNEEEEDVIIRDSGDDEDDDEESESDDESVTSEISEPDTLCYKLASYRLCMTVLYITMTVTSCMLVSAII